MPTTPELAKLIQALNDRAILPSDPNFDAAREVWNAMVNRKPSVIAKCHDGNDVALAIAAARAEGLPVSIRGGGHNIAGTAVGEGAMMIDLSGMRTIVIDAERREAQVEGGATWADLDIAAQAQGLAVPGGVVSTTGVAGLTLGGGFGWLARLHGLAADNLVSVDLVLADGTKVTASADDHTDLFWAIRGGSGNFGVATKFTFRMHDLAPEVLFGPTFFALNDAERVLQAYGKFASDLPREACVWANLMTAPPVPILPEHAHGTKVLNLVQFYAGDENTGRAHLGALYGDATPLGSGLAMRPFTEAQQFLDAAYPFGARNYWRAHNHTHLSDALISTLIDLAPDLPTPESELLICQLGGAISDVPVDATAFPHRNVPFVSTPGVRWHDASDDTRVIGWLKAASKRIAAHAVPGAYVNFVAETEGRAADAYGSNLSRLADIKRRYDPENLFRINQNVAPA